jgi:hypothetical protein
MGKPSGLETREVNFASLEVLLRRGLMLAMDLYNKATMARLALCVVETHTHPVSTNKTAMLSFLWASFLPLVFAQKWCAFFFFHVSDPYTSWGISGVENFTSKASSSSFLLANFPYRWPQHRKWF